MNNEQRLFCRKPLMRHGLCDAGSECREKGQNERNLLIRVVLPEADYWHRRGVATALDGAVDIELIDDGAAKADVVLLPLALIQERGLGEITRAATRYSAAVLVYGEVSDAAIAAEMLVAGALGYHAALDPPLGEAISIVANGQAWGPRAALRVLADRLRDGNHEEPEPDSEILEMLNEGLSNKEIGQRLGLAESTIKSRMNRLYKRFGVTSRLQLLAAAIRRGVVAVRRRDDV